jgi:two-component system, NtrC family, nitrogen regulation response regulator NtrX
MARRVLIVDDDPGIRDALKMTLEYEGYDVQTAPDGRAGLALLDGRGADAVLLDIKMPGIDGIEVLERLQATPSPPAVIMISGHGDIATAVECTRKGAVDFIEKPPQRERVLLSLKNALARASLQDENARLRQRIDEEYVLLGSSVAMQKLREEIARAAPTAATVLVSGESGSGKELVAREIHRQSRVARGPFVQVNCAAIPEELIESELFGHEKGSFTGAFRKQAGKFVEADGGTIFLDEVGDMSARTQAKVLRVLQEGEVEPVGSARVRKVDVRVIAATNKDLPAEIAAVRFREDLYFRLNVVPIRTPPLRERRDDIPSLAEHFARFFSLRNNIRQRTFSPGALEALAARDWPGNVRELKNLVERVVIMSDSDTVEVSDLPGDGRASVSDLAREKTDIETLANFKEFAEREFLVAKLKENSWNISRTAQAIHTPRSNLYKKIEHYGIRRQQDA